MSYVCMIVNGIYGWWFLNQRCLVSNPCGIRLNVGSGFNAVGNFDCKTHSESDL